MMPGDDVLMMPAARRIEVFTGVGRRRRWDAETKARIVPKTYALSVGEVGARYGICSTQLFTWRRDARQAKVAGAITFAPVVVEDEANVARADSGEIEVEFGVARVWIARGADESMAMAVIGALRGRR